jgi:hypothetical protein
MKRQNEFLLYVLLVFVFIISSALVLSALDYAFGGV